MKVRRHLQYIEPISVGTNVAEVFKRFRVHKDRAFVPVVDRTNRPVGIVREYDFKDYAYSYYGTELLLKRKLADFISPCLTVSHRIPFDDLLQMVGSDPQGEGVMVEEDGQYCGFLENRSLFRMFEENRLANEQRLAQMQRLESLGTLAGGIAHELNNMLLPIMGYAEMMLAESHGEDPNVPRLERMIRSADRARTIVSQLMAFGRKHEREVRPISVSDVVSESVGFLAGSALKGLQVEQRFHCDDDSVMGDPRLLQQLILNLLDNAVLAMNPGSGSIRIAVDQCRPDGDFYREHPGTVLGPFVQLRVEDDGVGIPQENLPRVFEPFFTTRSIGKGSGLGLSVAHGIVTSHGGVVIVESEVGTGTCVKVFLPKMQAAEDVAHRSDTERPARVRVVDEDTDGAPFAETALRGLGHDTPAVPCSAQGLKPFRRSAFGRVPDTG